MKNQISVEYLGTFGWIILVVMVTILSLSQFGLLNLGSEVPEECYLGEQIDCKAQYLDENGNLVMTLESKFNEEIEITNIDFEDYYIDINECSSNILKPNNEINVICVVRESETGDPKIFVEEKQKFDIELEINPKDTVELFYIKGTIISDILEENISTAFNCNNLVSTGGIVSFTWQCNGNILSKEEYLGEDLCCDGTIVLNPCGSAVPGGGSCCADRDCNAFSPESQLANEQCNYQEFGTKCCESCVSEFCYGLPRPEGDCHCNIEQRRWTCF